MRTSFSFKSNNSASASYIFGVDSYGFSQITIDGSWIYNDFRSKSPSYYLTKINELSSIRLTTSDEISSTFFIDKLKSSITKQYIGEIGAFIKTSESNLIFLSNSLRENSVIEIFFEVEISKERDAELITAIENYREKSKTIKFEEPIVEFYIMSTAFRSISSEAST
jgi:hypothetical protein